MRMKAKKMDLTSSPGLKSVQKRELPSMLCSEVSTLKSEEIEGEQSLNTTGEYIVDRNKPETFLNLDDLERVTESDIYPQKRLFSFLHSKKIPHIPSEEERTPIPINSANYLSRLFIWWVYAIVRTGYKRTIQPNDLFKVEGSLSIEVLYDRFEENMQYYFKRSRDKFLVEHSNATEEEISVNITLPKNSIVKALFFTFRKEILWAVFCANLANCAAAFNPMITKRLINFVQDKALAPDLHVNNGIGYAIGACIMMVVNGLAFNHLMFQSQLLGIQVKSVLTKAILVKMFRASGYAKHKYPNGKVTSFVTTDLSRIEFALSYQPFLTGFPAIISIVIVLLIINVGAIALVGIGIFFLAIFLSLFAVKYVIKFKKEANFSTDARVTMMREVLNNMKMIKFYAWEDAYESDIGSLRGKEVVKVRKSLYVRNLLVGLGLYLPTFSSFATFVAMYKTNRDGRSAANIFSSLSLFQVLTVQMFLLPLAVTTGSDMLLGFSRLQGLFESPEEKNSNKPTVVYNTLDKVALRMIDAAFRWEDFQLTDKIEEKSCHGTNDIKISSKYDDNSKSSIDCDRDISCFAGFKDLNFEINKGEFLIITGPIGTGKTSLLNAMSGLMDKISGKVEVNGDLLLCGYPWIQNATVRDNIIFGSSYEEKKYKEVIRVCALETDFDILPTGDMTEIGERGITLSGGQKARINLARTVYKDKSIYLFDDILSAVDSHVGKHIVDECLMGTLMNKTRIMATHQLSLIDKADRIIVLGSDGSFEIGELQELKKHNQTLMNLLQYMSHSNEDGGVKVEDGENYEDDDGNGQDVLLAGLREREKHMIKNSGSAHPLESKVDELKKEPSLITKELPKGGITIREERAVNGIKFDIYKEYFTSAFGKIGILVFPFFFMGVTGSTFCTLFSSIWLSYWTENKFAHRSSSFYMGLYSLFVFGGYFFLNGAYALLCYSGLSSSKALNLRAVKRVLHSPMNFIDTTPIGRILNRFTKDTDSLDNEMSESLRLLLTQAANIIGVFILCIVYLPWFAIAIPFFAFAFLIISNHYQCTGREVIRLEAIQRSFVYNNFNEVLGGMETIKCLRAQERFLAKNDFLINRMNEAAYLRAALQRWVAISLNIIGVLFALVITLLCVTRQFNISASAVGVLLTYILQLPGLLNNLLRAITQTENGMNSTERIISYAKHLPMEADYKKPETCPPDSWPFEGKINFTNVSFAYRPGLPSVLKDFNASINGGEKIGICGRTGAGKSTIMSAIYRLNELAGGIITIDGIDISNLGIYDLRRKLSIIPQDPVLVKGTVRKNLDPFKERSDDRLWEALISGGAISADELEEIKMQKVDANGSLSNMHKFHLDQQVEEEGFNFSLGERQVLALTRALVRQTKILILDEATSSVDYETDEKIQAKIVESFKDSTILCIAHRLKTILKYDRVLVLNGGQVVEFDAPCTLFEQGGIFTQMCSRAGIIRKDFEE